MPMIKANHATRFTVITNEALEDPRLSNAAKGLLVRMLSLPDDWEFNVRGLAAICRDGRDAIRRQLQELEDGGYLKRRPHAAGGRFGAWEYSIYEQPCAAPQPASPCTDSPCTESPCTESPRSDFPPQPNKNLQNKKQQNKNLPNTISTNPRSGRRTAEEIEALLDFEMLRYEFDPALLSAVSALLTEAEECTGELRVNGRALPAAAVRDRFRTLDDEHVRFVLNQLAETGGQVRNLRSWLRTALFNAPETMEAYVTALYLSAQNPGGNHKNIRKTY